MYDDWEILNRRNNNNSENEDFFNYVPRILRDNIYGAGKKTTEAFYSENLSPEFLIAQTQADRQKRLDWFKREYQEEREQIAQLDPTEKLLEAVNRAAILLPSEVAEEIKAIFTPATLATMVGVFAAYIAAHATGIGQAMDIGMLIAGGIFFGLDAFAIFKDIAGFAGAVNATTEEELDKAGQHLASAVAKIGVDAVMTLLTKKVADEVGKGLDNVNQVDEVHAHHDPDVDPLDGLKYPEGTNIDKKLPIHLKDFDGVSKKGVSGAHNLDTFNQVVANGDALIVSKTEHPTISGIYKIKYRARKNDGSGSFRSRIWDKTVYDPAIHSDEKIVEFGQIAVSQGMEKAISNGNSSFTEFVDGIKFQVYFDPETRLVRNIYPVIED